MLYELFFSPHLKKHYLYNIYKQQYTEVPAKDYPRIQLFHHRGFVVLFCLALGSSLPQLSEYAVLAISVLAYTLLTWMYFKRILPTFPWKHLSEGSDVYHGFAHQFEAKRLRFNAGIFIVLAIALVGFLSTTPRRSLLLETILSIVLIAEAARQIWIWYAISKKPLKQPSADNTRLVQTKTNLKKRK